MAVNGVLSEAISSQDLSTGVQEFHDEVIEVKKEKRDELLIALFKKEDEELRLKRENETKILLEKYPFLKEFIEKYDCPFIIKHEKYVDSDIGEYYMHNVGKITYDDGGKYGRRYILINDKGEHIDVPFKQYDNEGELINSNVEVKELHEYISDDINFVILFNDEAQTADRYASIDNLK